MITTNDNKSIDNFDWKQSQTIKKTGRDLSPATVYFPRYFDLDSAAVLYSASEDVYSHEVKVAKVSYPVEDRASQVGLIVAIV